MSSIHVPQARHVTRPASRADADAQAALLAGAFFDDPLTRWITPDDTRRAQVLPGFFRVFLDMAFDYDAVITTAGGDAVLLYLPPGAWEEVEERRGEEFGRRFAAVLGDDAVALRTIATLQAERHPAHRPHYYALFGAVRPAARGAGLLTDLLGGIVARADAEGRPMYTEASSPGGEATGRRWGFTPLGADIVLPGGGPSLRPLWRDPR